jgi:hypothetical protein
MNKKLIHDAGVAFVSAVVGLQRFAVEPYLQKCAGVGVRQNFGAGERVNVGDDFARPRFDEATGGGFAGGVLVFDCDGAVRIPDIAPLLPSVPLVSKPPTPAPVPVPAIKITAQAPSMVTKKKFVTREHLATVFHRGAQSLNRTVPVAALKKLGFGKNGGVCGISTERTFFRLAAIRAGRNDYLDGMSRKIPLLSGLRSQ